MLIVERWILARLRNHRFNKAIKNLVADFSDRPFEKLPGTRPFERLDRLVLRPAGAAL